MQIKEDGSEAYAYEEGNPYGFVTPLCCLADRLREGFEAGNLPWPGGLMSQPARAMNLIRMSQTMEMALKARALEMDVARQRRKL